MKAFKRILLSAGLVLSAIQSAGVMPVSAEQTAAQAPILAQSQETESAISRLSEGTVFAVPAAQETQALVPVRQEAPAIRRLPDFSNDAMWKHSPSPYNIPSLWGQCTWFAWGRFMEIYGYDPGFRGNGYECVDQLLAAHPDKFTRSDIPTAGALFSSYNHVGFILEVDGDSWTIQEGNLDQVSNPDWETAIQDWRTVTMTRDEFMAQTGAVWFANPVSPVTFSKE